MGSLGDGEHVQGGGRPSRIGGRPKSAKIVIKEEGVVGDDCRWAIDGARLQRSAMVRVSCLGGLPHRRDLTSA